MTHLRENLLDLHPAPGPASTTAALRAEWKLNTRTWLRNGEQLLLTIGIPLILLVALTALPLVDGYLASWPSSGTAPTRVDVVFPGVAAVAIVSTAFTAQAIATGFDRRYGVLKWTGSTPLSRGGLLAGRTLTVVTIEVLQLILLTAVAVGLGWRPEGNFGSVLALIVLGTAAFSAWGIAVAGLLRAEATLAVANGVFILMVLLGGLVIPLASLPRAVATVAEFLPSAAIGEGLRAVMLGVETMPLASLGLLAAWACAGVLVTVRTFSWE